MEEPRAKNYLITAMLLPNEENVGLESSLKAIQELLNMMASEVGATAEQFDSRGVVGHRCGARPLSDQHGGRLCAPGVAVGDDVSTLQHDLEKARAEKYPA